MSRVSRAGAHDRPAGDANKSRSWDGEETLRRIARLCTEQQKRVPLDPERAFALYLPSQVLEVALARPASKVRALLVTRLRELERTLGDSDGTLDPIDLLEAKDPLLKVIAQQITRQLDGAPAPKTSPRSLDSKRNRWHGQGIASRRLTIEEIESALPGALGAMLYTKNARSTEPERTLFLAAAHEALSMIGAEFRPEVIERGTRLESFFAEWRFPTSKVYVAYKQMRGDAPDFMPALSRADLKTFYDRAIAGEITAKYFYGVTGLDEAGLRELQRSDPKKFPRPPGLDPDSALPRVDRDVMHDVEALSHAWHSEYLTGRRSLGAFCAAQGIDPRKMDVVRETNPLLFPAALERIPGTVRRDETLAKAVGDASRAALDRDPFINTVDALLREIRDVPAIRAHEENAGKPIDRQFFLGLRNRFKKLVPPLPKRKDRVQRLKKEIDAIRRDQPELTRHELGLELDRRFAHLNDPNFWMWLVEKSHPGTVPAGDAAAVRRAARSETRPKAAVREGFKPAMMMGELVARIAPPCTRSVDIVRTLNGLMEKNRLPPYWIGIDKRDQSEIADLTGLPPLEPLWFSQIAEILVEYANAAPRHTKHEAIVASVLDDYPRLKGYLKKFERALIDDPARFPKLARHVEGGALVLEGGGRAQKRAKWLGGWDFDKHLAALDNTERAEMARLVEATRIPYKLPLLEAQLERLGGRRPLVGKKLVMLGHVLSDTPAFVQALRRAGVARKDLEIVGTPYGANELAVETLRAQGLKVEVPGLDEEKYRALAKAALDRVADEIRRTNETAIVLDDGGVAARLLHDPETAAEYADVIDKFRLVEQTKGGLNYAAGVALKTPVVAVARAEAKHIEAEAIGKVVAARIFQAARRAGRDLDGKTISVMGQGWIGSEVVKSIQDYALAHGIDVEILVYDSNDAAAKSARKPAKPVSRREAIERGDLIIGTTGKMSIKAEDLPLLKPNAMLTSASSKRKEFAMDALKSWKRTEIPSGNPVVTLPNARYRRGDQELIVLGDGYPINFDGSAEVTPPDWIQITDAAMFAAAIQSAVLSTPRDAGVIEFGSLPGLSVGPRTPKAKWISADDEIIADYRRLMQKNEREIAVSDADAWPDVLRELDADLRRLTA